MSKLIKTLGLVCALIVNLPALAEDPIYTGLFNNVAVGGHDAVAYFTEGIPVKGSKKFKSEYMDAEFRFSSEGNKTVFDADPARYAPQYGGYCAWAVSQGYTASGDPEHWSIVDNKLYLNYNKKIATAWKADIPGFIKLGDNNWPALLEE